MADGKELKAPIVISAAGVKTTVNKLVPDQFKNSEWGNSLRSIGDSPSYLCLNIAFKGDIASKGASSSNMWLYTVDNNDQRLWDITNPDEIPHLLYVSFPSMKNPEHVRNQKETGECVTFVDWDAFAKWDDTTSGNREEAYEKLKTSIEKRMLAELQKRIPDIMEQIDFCELSTPLTSKHYCRASKGAIYGLDASIARFSNPHLRTRTPIKNFYLSGVDVATVGVVSGMVSGILTAATIDKRAYLKLL
jgi:all-trans-retinol 13,14-reductase